MALKLVIADDHKVYLESLEYLLTHHPKSAHIEVVATADNGKQLLRVVKRAQPDVIIMDLNMPEKDGLEVLPILKTSFPKSKVVILTMYDNPKFIKEVFEGGGDGYLLKTCPVKEILTCIQVVMENKTYLAEGMRIFPKNLINHQANEKFFDEFLGKYNLTKREMEILILISQAKSNKEIGGLLYISDQTVGVHRKNIMRKLNLSNTAGLIKFAMDNQLI